MLTRMVLISWPHDPPASASQSAGITGLSHRAWPALNFLTYQSFPTQGNWFLNQRKLLLASQAHSIHFSFHCHFHVGHKPLAHLLEPLISFPLGKSIIKTITSQCSICHSTNLQGCLRPLVFPTHQGWGFISMQDWQIDFTHIPHVRKFKYLLVWVDTFTEWIKAFPTGTEKATTLISCLLNDTIPLFGLPTSMQFDNGPSFINQITQAVSQALSIQWNLHAPTSHQEKQKKLMAF